MKLSIHILNRLHAVEVNQLRKEGYQRIRGFHVQPEGLFWNRSDDQAIVLGVQDTEGALVSTMRLELIEDLKMVETKLESTWSFPSETQWPVGVLSRASTRFNWAGRGLNGVLRYHALKMAEGFGVRYMTGTFVTGSPREKTMLAMGYQVFTNTKGWSGHGFQSSAPITVATLDLKRHSQKAYDELLLRQGKWHSKVQLMGPPPEYKVMRVVR